MQNSDRTSSLPAVTDEERIVRIQRALQRRFRAAGHGSIQRVQQALGLGDGYFKDQRRPGRRRVDLRVLFRALDLLGVEPADFFADALGSVDALTVFRSEAEALAVKLQPQRILELERRREGRAEEAADLAALDAMRLESPRRVVRRAHVLILQLAERQVPTLLGIYASACRLSGRLDQAQVVLARALDLAEANGDSASFGDLVQRASYIVADRGDCEGALTLSERATLTYVRAADLAGIGKTLVDQGIWHGHLGRQRRAIRTFERALEGYLPADSERTDVRRHRLSCLMNLGNHHLLLGELDEARRFAEMAREQGERMSPGLRGKLVWLQASIARRSGRLDQAERYVLEALEIYRPISPLEAAVASVELVLVQLRRDRSAEAYETARSMTRLLEPLRANPIASAALMELLRCAVAGHGLTTTLVGRVARGLAEGRSPAAKKPR